VLCSIVGLSWVRVRLLLRSVEGESLQGREPRVPSLFFIVVPALDAERLLVLPELPWAGHSKGQGRSTPVVTFPDHNKFRAQWHKLGAS
jgi:hypothetical protein